MKMIRNMKVKTKNEEVNKERLIKLKIKLNTHMNIKTKLKIKHI